MRRLVLRAAPLLTLLGVAVVALLVLRSRIFLARMLTYPDNPVTDAGWYQPREPVHGAPGEELPVVKALRHAAKTFA